LLRKTFVRYNYIHTEYPGQLSKSDSFVFISENVENMKYRKSRSHVQAFIFHVYEVSGSILNPEMGILIVNFLLSSVTFQTGQAMYI
jgi:hypothetical protein